MLGRLGPDHLERDPLAGQARARHGGRDGRLDDRAARRAAPAPGVEAILAVDDLGLAEALEGVLLVHGHGGSKRGEKPRMLHVAHLGKIVAGKSSRGYSRRLNSSSVSMPSGTGMAQ